MRWRSDIMKASDSGQTMMSRTRTTSETKLVEVADLANPAK